MSTPAVSVLMPVYNARRYVGTAIESLLQQTMRDFELIVLDDGSRDDSQDIVRSFAGRDRRVRWLARENRGLIATRNELLAAARSPYCALLDADDIARPERLELQLDYLESHPECVLVGSRVLLIDAEGAPLCEMFDEFEHGVIYDTLLSGRPHHLCNPAIMMRRAAVEQAGGYREGFAPAEDLDLFLRLAEHGQLVNLPQVLTSYRQHLASEGYARAHIQRAAAYRAVNEARRRRGLAELLREQTGYDSIVWTAGDHYRKWCWWALNAGYVSTARKYALATVRHSPLTLESWRAMYCSLRGH